MNEALEKILQKLTLIVKNIAKVFDVGYEKGYKQSITDNVKEEQEKTVEIAENCTVEISPDANKVLSKVIVKIKVSSNDSYYNVLWDGIQQNGNRTHYGSAHASPTTNMRIWTDANYIPKYDMRPTSTNGMYKNSDIEDIKGILKKLGRVLDMSICTDSAQMFYGSTVVYPPDLDLTKSPHLNGTFNGCKQVKAIVLKNIQSTMTYVNNPFRDCTQLTDVWIEGEIGTSFDIKWSPLTAESAKSIITHLVNYTGTENEFIHSVYFSETTWSYLDAEGNAAPDGTSWREYVQYTLGWNI